jgi:hypothetical protein
MWTLMSEISISGQQPDATMKQTCAGARPSINPVNPNGAAASDNSSRGTEWLLRCTCPCSDNQASGRPQCCFQQGTAPHGRRLLRE